MRGANKSRPRRPEGPSLWDALAPAVRTRGLTGPRHVLRPANLPDSWPADLSPPSPVPTPQLGKRRPRGAARSRGSGSNVCPSPALTFWARVSSSAWISNSPSSESLLRAWGAAPRRFRSPFFFFHWAMAARDRGPAPGLVPAAMRAPAQGNGKGRSLRGRTNGAALVALPPFLPPQEAWRALSPSLDWPAKPLSEALGISGGVQKGDPLPGANGSGHVAPPPAGCCLRRARSTRR